MFIELQIASDTKSLIIWKFLRQTMGRYSSNELISFGELQSARKLIINNIYNNLN